MILSVGITSCRINTSRPGQNGRYFPDDIFKCIFLNENAPISFEISLKFVRRGPINNIPELVQIMTWRRPGDTSLSEPRIVSLLTHICVTRPQWAKHHSGDLPNPHQGDCFAQISFNLTTENIKGWQYHRTLNLKITFRTIHLSAFSGCNSPNDGTVIILYL